MFYFGTVDTHTVLFHLANAFPLPYCTLRNAKHCDHHNKLFILRTPFLSHIAHYGMLNTVCSTSAQLIRTLSCSILRTPFLSHIAHYGMLNTVCSTSAQLIRTLSCSILRTPFLCHIAHYGMLNTCVFYFGTVDTHTVLFHLANAFPLPYCTLRNAKHCVFYFSTLDTHTVLFHLANAFPLPYCTLRNAKHCDHHNKLSILRTPFLSHIAHHGILNTVCSTFAHVISTLSCSILPMPSLHPFKISNYRTVQARMVFCF